MIEVIVESTEKMVENLPETFLLFSKDKPTPLDMVNFTSMNVDILG